MFDEFTCDICKVPSNESLAFDDLHDAMGGTYAFLCELCQKINNGFWSLSGISVCVDMELQMNKRAFKRMRVNNNKKVV